jgi:RNA polymerase sigma-70 factor (ECF subfamily)
METTARSQTTARMKDLARTHGGALYRLAASLTTRHADAEDLVQSTYERALRRGIHGVPDDRMRAWLFTIARNQFVDRYRSRRSCPITYSSQAMDSAVEDARALELEDEPRWRSLGLEDLRRAVEHLSPTLSLVYRLHAFDQLDYAAIAARVGIPVNTVATRLRRARLRLRELLERDGGCLPLRPLRPRRVPRRRPSALQDAA